MSEAERQNQPDPAASAPRDLRGPGEGPTDARSRTYGARRRSWIRIHGRDDRFLIFIGVLILVGTLFLVAYKVIEGWRKGPDHPPVPLAELFYGAAEEVAPGVVRAEYDYKINPRIRFLREACPQIGDWQITGTVANDGILVSGDNRYRPFFTGDDLSLECDAALIFGSQIVIGFRDIHDGEEGSYYQLELNASRGQDWPATAQISEWREGGRVRSSELATLKDLKARRNPPLFYRVKFELSGGTLRGCFGPAGQKPREVCRLPAGDLTAGIVLLRGPGSQTAFDNVVVTGRPHQEFVSKRTEIYWLFQADEPRGGKKKAVRPPRPPESETAPPAKS